MSESTLREHGLRIGHLEAGAANAITDVAGVRVGHVTVVRDEPSRPSAAASRAPASRRSCPGRATRSSAARCRPAATALNGAGELTGYLQISEWGLIETPIFLTSTMAVGRVFDGAVAACVRGGSGASVADEVVIPVVGECDDSWLNDARTVQVEAEDAGRAVRGCDGRRRRPGLRRRRHRDDRARLEGRHRLVEPPRPRGRGDGRRPRARELRLGPRTCGSTACPVFRDDRRRHRPASAGRELHRRRRDRRAAQPAPSSSASRGARASGSRAPARLPTTGAARSSSPSRPLRPSAARAPPIRVDPHRPRPRTSTRSSPPSSRRPRRRC